MNPFIDYFNNHILNIACIKSSQIKNQLKHMLNTHIFPFLNKYGLSMKPVQTANLFIFYLSGLSLLPPSCLTSWQYYRRGVSARVRGFRPQTTVIYSKQLLHTVKSFRKPQLLNLWFKLNWFGVLKKGRQQNLLCLKQSIYVHRWAVKSCYLRK